MNPSNITDELKGISENRPYILAAQERSTGRDVLSSGISTPQEDNFHPVAAGEYHGPTIGWARYKSGLLVNNIIFQDLIIFVIILNSITMGIGTFDFVTEDPDMDARFENLDQIFLIIFTVEVGFQFLYHGFDLFKDGFLTFDFLIVVLSWVFQPLQAFRILRAVRIVSR